MTLYLTITMTRTKEAFPPANPHQVTIPVQGQSEDKEPLAGAVPR